MLSPAQVGAPSGPLQRALDRALRTWDGARVLRVEVPVEPVDALVWLGAQVGAPAAYWRGRGDAEAWAGVGAALVVDANDLRDPALSDIVEQLPPRARLFATARFDAAAEVGQEWSAFGAVRLWLPRAEVRSDGRRATLAVHVAPGERGTSARAALRRLAAPLRAMPTLPLPFMRRDDPERAEWDRMLGWARSAFADNRLGKVVLARRARFLFDEALDATALLAQLEATTPRCYHALVAPQGVGAGPAFLTATPERLLRLDPAPGSGAGRALSTEAVAGTRPRAEADAADDRLRAELLASEKDRREHAFVVRAILDALRPLADRLDADGDASAMTLARGRHLRTGIRAEVSDAVGALDVLRALHPTPAVGGTPTDGALDAIRRLEPFDRGLYAGPVGWIGRDDDGAEAADLAVGIRSGLVAGRTLSLYSGAGIVPGSNAAAEWAEIEHKIGGFARVLGLSERVEA